MVLQNTIDEFAQELKVETKEAPTFITDTVGFLLLKYPASSTLQGDLSNNIYLNFPATKNNNNYPNFALNIKICIK